MHMKNQNGMTLVEILVGLVIGLLIVAIALTSLQVSQFVSTTVNESVSLRQDANTALRIIGLQIRQTGSIALNIQPALGNGLEPEAMRPVIFEPVLNSDGKASTVNESLSAVGSPSVSKSVGNALQVQYENFIEFLLADSTKPSMDSALRDCLGQNKSNRLLSNTITSTFFLRDGNLMCTGVAGTPQPIIGNVKDFALHLLLRIPGDTASAEPHFQYMAPADLNRTPQQWTKVSAVEVCLELESPGTKAPNVDATYQKCDGQIQAKGDRLVILTRQLFHIRATGE
ncbi:prepilin-type N-terminal cleavage/methylation domain-containing protein [Diaphorobacter sp. HDW4B]|uniref:PilW family protein n=1 Tax=Diaphorobacter sp. HDW4B TaxID=2714925 RepID=UPI00140E260D|nr:prepilin-type N-terminal cleavage/methylation domain-containing protein [Diaphorobacter sp. HDW4B]QIL70820.1 prepilin-type N-terminal cleavage/methylation domain-containing protein [Diaphorobacter sp. HDW4B]